MRALRLPGLPDDDALRARSAIPEGYRAPTSAAAWMRRVVEQHPAVQALRTDHRDRVLAVAGAIADYTDRRSLTARPTWEILAAAAAVPRRALARWLRWLRQHLLLAHVEQGSTAQFRRGPDDGAGNRAAVYALIRPSAPAAHCVADTPSDLPTEGSLPTARENELSTQPAALRAAGCPDQEPWPDTVVARTGAERLSAAQTIRVVSPVARRVSDRHVRSLIRPFMVAGWCTRDIVHALDFMPDGEAHRYAYNAADLRSPGGWIAHRLRLWVAEDGAPLPGHRQVRQAAVDQLRIERADSPSPTTAPMSTEPFTPAADSDEPLVPPLAALARDRDLRERARLEREHREQARIANWLAGDEASPAGIVDDDQRQTRILHLARARAAADRAARRRNQP